MIRKVAIISLSAGTLGEPFVRHELEIGVRRLQEFGLQVTFTPHALRGREYLSQHPEARAEDLLQAFGDESVDMILCAIGGDDTYRLLPWLFDDDALKKAISRKVFLGFSDTTMNHFMLHKLGLNTFYGQAFLPDICELDRTMLPYTEHYFQELLTTGTISKITPSDKWYEERLDFSPQSVNTPRLSHRDNGFILVQGEPRFQGEILGGCLETMFDFFDTTRYSDSVELCAKHGLFPSLDEWRGRILLLETSEEQPSPEHYREMVRALKKSGVFEAVSGVLCGKPMNRLYMEAYLQILKEEIQNPDLPVLANLNVGHATPRCIIPFGVNALVDAEAQTITFIGGQSD